MGIQFQLKGEMGMNKYEKAFNHLREHASFDTVDEKTALVCPSCKSLLVER